MANGGPAWIETASKVVQQVGFPIVVAAVLLWWTLFKFQITMDMITARMERNADVAEAIATTGTETNKLMAAQIEEMRRQTRALEDINRLARERKVVQ